MDKIVYITPSFAVTSALVPEDFEMASKLGFRAIINNRPDGEEDGQVSSRQTAVLAWRAGLGFRHVPAPKHDLFTDAVVEASGEALSALQGPVLAYCKSGLRSAIVWAAASARLQSVDSVLEALDKAGFDLDFLRDDLEQQADRSRWQTPKAPESASLVPLEAA